MRSKSTKVNSEKKSSSDFTRCEMVTQKPDDLLKAIPANMAQYFDILKPLVTAVKQTDMKSMSWNQANVPSGRNVTTSMESNASSA